LSRADVQAEAVFLGLRLLRGIDLCEHRARFGVDLREEKADDLSRLSEAGLIELTGDLLKLTRTGALLSNEVFATFV
jgi:oxygen-independent coproporphyrinogen-3 oxidase